LYLFIYLFIHLFIYCNNYLEYDLVSKKRYVDTLLQCSKTFLAYWRASPQNLIKIYLFDMFLFEMKKSDIKKNKRQFAS